MNSELKVGRPRKEICVLFIVNGHVRDTRKKLTRANTNENERNNATVNASKERVVTIRLTAYTTTRSSSAGPSALGGDAKYRHRLKPNGVGGGSGLPLTSRKIRF